MDIDDQKNLRRRWVAYWREVHEAGETGASEQVPFPPELLNLRCGAKTRAGTPCKINALFNSGRCKLHGGLSTGPTSVAGKERSAQNGKPHHQAEHPDGVALPAINLVHMSGKKLSRRAQGNYEAAAARACSDGGVAEGDMIRCVDCAFISAAHTCTLNVAKGTHAWVERVCADFEEGAWLIDNATTYAVSDDDAIANP